jgi:DNA helicase IV
LTPAECAALARPRSASLEEIPWTPADLPLLDEARVLLGTRRPTEDDAIRAYGHIVVDEAQDLTPMQLRMLGRRSISGSMTIVGDIAQATGQRAPESWDEVLGYMLGNKTPRIVELSVNYRTPAEIMALAGRVLTVAAPGLRQPRSVRSTETPPTFVASAADSFGADVAATVRREQAQLSAGPGGIGVVAIICPPSLHDSLAASLRDAGIVFGDAEADGLEQPVTLVPVTVVKGLEFDGVIVAEPAAIVAETPQGLRSLYVALTRATRRLAIVHAEDLPAPIA